MSKNRIKISEEKIQKAIDRGELIPHEKVVDEKCLTHGQVTPKRKRSVF